MSRTSPREDISGGAFSTLSNPLLRMVGGWGNIGGPGLFMVRTMTSGTITSIFMGVTASVCSAMLYDTAGLPFVIFSCLGFAIGSFGFYFDAVRKALVYLDRYPRLLQVHLDANFPHRRFDLWPRRRLHRGSFDGWVLRSMLVIGWLSAMPAIENIIDLDDQREIERGAAGDDKETLESADS